MLTDFVQDLKYGARVLMRSRGFAIAAVLTLSIGIGATTAIFSVVNGVLLRPVPFADIDRLTMVWETDRNTGTNREPASFPDFIDLKDRSRQFTGFAAFADAFAWDWPLPAGCDAALACAAPPPAASLREGFALSVVSA